MEGKRGQHCRVTLDHLPFPSVHKHAVTSPTSGKTKLSLDLTSALFLLYSTVLKRILQNLATPLHSSIHCHSSVVLTTLLNVSCEGPMTSPLFFSVSSASASSFLTSCLPLATNCGFLGRETASVCPPPDTPAIGFPQYPALCLRLSRFSAKIC